MNQEQYPPENPTPSPQMGTRREGPHPEHALPRRMPVKLPEVTPFVTYAILGITAMVFLLQIGSETLLGIDLPASFGLKSNRLIFDGQLWRLITPMFLHGSILHIAFNLYALLIIGRGLERHLGHTRYAVLYFLSGFAGNVISFMFTTSNSLGSSTAIFGLLGAQGVFLYQNQKLLGGIARRALNNIITVAMINLFIGLSPGIDNWGHIGGLLGGTLFTWLAGPMLDLEGIYPMLSLVDKRDPGEVLRAAIIVAGFFSLLVVGAFLLESF